MNNLPKITQLNPKATADTNRRAVALVLTLVVLAVLTTIVYGLSSRIAQVKHRRQYIIDYQISRYACDSATKYALAAIKQMDFNLINTSSIWMNGHKNWPSGSF
jgi:type II secretory pathway component PulK